MRDLPAPMHVREEDIMRLLKVPDIEHLLYEIRYLNKYIEEEFLFKDHVQEAYDHIYEVEVKALEQQCIDEGFIQGFLKGVHLVQQKAGVEVEGLTLSQASDDFPPDSDGNEIESELQKACALEVDGEVVDIE
ncbi:hypothetical protein IEQ34_003246 [Dendrobium chrysotoxum]|uniref:Uncharacterized protein n=1 Tax=Dendrobium chrysotoxum TaxID=161865 RepID=A0AAV7HL54_DENCH|nr:hypothetical protein IEQ34_003246 [Dendrobium chrysotoxum]